MCHRREMSALERSLILIYLCIPLTLQICTRSSILFLAIPIRDLESLLHIPVTKCYQLISAGRHNLFE